MSLIAAASLAVRFHLHRGGVSLGPASLPVITDAGSGVRGQGEAARGGEDEDGPIYQDGVPVMVINLLPAAPPPSAAQSHHHL